MARDHLLLYALSAVILINIVAIVMLQARVAEIPEHAPVVATITAPVLPVTAPLVRTLILPAPCDDCFDISEYAIALNDTINMAVETVPQDRIPAFGSALLPAIAFNQTLEEYPALVRGWEGAGSIINLSGEYAGTWYLLPTQNAPYYDAANRTVRGRVGVTYITMRSCQECYDVAESSEWLADVRITPYSERTVDAESPAGRELVTKYGITAVPTLILDSGAAEHSTLQPGWSIVGTVEDDGFYVLRDLQRMGVVYYDLQSKKLMKP
jgi:hypothetical protein